jgi:uncharacterized protein (DUF849 family)
MRAPAASIALRSGGSGSARRARASTAEATRRPDCSTIFAAAATELGGNVRVGLEDNFYLPSGEMATSNGDLVAAATNSPDGR